LRLPILLGLAIAVVVATYLWRAGYFAERTAPVVATQPNALGAVSSAEKQTAEQAAKTEADRIAAESKTEAERAAAAQRAEAEQKARAEQQEAEKRAAAEAAERERQAAELQRREAETARAKTERAEADWTAARAGGVEALENYLRLYPDGPRAAEARAALDAAQLAAQRAADEAKAKTAAEATRAAEEAKAKAAAEARKAEAEAKSKAAEQDWPAAQAGGAAALKSYLDRYPDGPRAAEARAALDGLTKSPARRPEAANRFTVINPPRADDRRGAAQPKGVAAQADEGASSARRFEAASRASADKPRIAARRTTRRTLANPGQPAPDVDTNGRRVIRIARTTGARPKIASMVAARAAPATPARAPAATSAALARTAAFFPDDPPQASARFDIPDAVFAGMNTYGTATKFVLAALASAGYAKRDVFSTPAGDVAMLTPLERIDDAGASAQGDRRWALALPRDGAVADAIELLKGRVSLEKGRYRAILLMLHDQPAAAAKAAETPTSARHVRGTRCAAMIYEFFSDGSTIRLVENGLPAKEHLAKSGLLAALERR